MFGATGGWAQFVWVGGAADGDIADQNNWSGGTVPTFVGGAENVTFGDATHTAVLLGSVSRSIGNLTFSSTAAAYSFSGTSLPTLTLAGNITTTVANPNAVVFGSAIDPITVAFTNTAHTINLAAGSAVDFLADISGGGASILKTGTGILTLSGANTYSGGTTVHSGTLEVDGGSISHPGADMAVGDVNGDNGMLAITGGAVVNSNNGFIGNGAGSIGTVTVAGGSTVYSSWILSGGLYVGENGTGSLTLSDYYTEVDSNSVVIGDAVNSVGTVTVNDGWLNDSGALVVGKSGTGILAINVNQGEVDGSSVIIGDASGGVGTVKIDGGILFDKGELLVGNSGTGTLSVANGGVVSVINGARTITLGANGGVGTLNIGAQSGDPAAAGGILNAGTVTTGSGTGTLQVNTTADSATPYYFTQNGTAGGTAVVITGPTQVINTAGFNVLTGANTYTGGTTVNNGTLEVNGGSISHPAADLVVGDVNGDNGMLAITGGAVVNSNNGFIGNGAGSIGTVTVAGGSTVYSSWILSGGLYVGENGTGSLTLSDYYTEVDSNSVVIGDAVNSVGTVTVNDGWLNDSGALVVGKSGTGILAINVNQGEVDGSSVIIGDASGGVGTVKIDGGILFDKGELLVGNSGTGTLSVANGGVVSVINGARTITLGANGGVGTLNIGAQSGDPAAAGGILNAGTVTTGSGTGTLQVNTTADSATPYYFTQNGTAGGTAVVITGPTQVINTAGFNVLTGANTYSGATTVNGGTLGVGNNASLGSSSVTLNGGQLSVGSGVTVTNPISFGSNGGTLGGNGAFGSHIVVGGNVILSPGNSPGTLTFTSGLTFGQGGAYDWQIQSVTSSPGTSWDNVAVTGPLDITATTGDPFTIRVLSLNASGSSGPVSDFSSGNNYSWIIASASGGISGFASSEFAIDISGFQNSLGGGSLFVTQDGTNLMLDFTPVPEPSTYALMAAGLMVLAWRRRRILRG